MNIRHRTTLQSALDMHGRCAVSTTRRGDRIADRAVLAIISAAIFAAYLIVSVNDDQVEQRIAQASTNTTTAQAQQ